MDVLAGRNIAARRRERGLTQDDLARALQALGVDMGAVTISRAEAGRRRLTLDDLVVLAAALGASASDLFAGDVDVELRPDVVVSAAAVRAALDGRGGELLAELTGGPHASHDGRAPATERGVGEADRWAARRLGVTVEELVARARARWAMTLTEKRDAMVVPEAYGGSAREELRAARRQVTRWLLTELDQEEG